MQTKTKFFLIIFTILLLVAAMFIFFFSGNEGEIEVMVLMYHDIATYAAADNPWVVSADAFSNQMQLLAMGNYPVISFDDLIAFVDGKLDLPQRVILISFDDGYQSNLDLAAPVLEELSIPALISVLGVQLGQSTYRHTDIPELPFFHLEDTIPWVQAGVFSIGHHSYDMHMLEYREPAETFRMGVLRREDETYETWRAAFTEDFLHLQTKLYETLGVPATIFAYPFGHHNEETENLLKELGIRVTLTSIEGINTVRQGEPQSLFALRRVNIEEHMVGDYFINYLNWAWTW